ncbi:hypothetical protein ACQPZP_02720 [Spirillospora sp. CA-142024]|uniref:hypothetical protein n=1 Tax=Spirillospora sp. CA-142024 TaxID=3240036 RepID=UPI003D8A114D
MSALEARYRRLLAWYPAEHRAGHETEMLDVLLSAARPDQTRPSLADAADLLYGAVRIRLRRAAGGATGSAWPGALAMAGFLAMLMLVADGVRFAVNVPQMSLIVADRVNEGAGLPGRLAVNFGTAPYWLAWAGIAALAWNGARRPAATAACAVTAAQVVLVIWGTTFQEDPYAFVAASLAGVPLPLALLATASLVASPGPRHGARLLGRVRIAGVTAMAAALILLTTQPLFTFVYQGDLGLVSMRDPNGLVNFAQRWGYVQLAAVLATAVLITATLSRSSQGRRVCALLATAGAPLVVRVGLFHIGASDEFPNLASLLVKSLIGFTLVMLCVRLVEVVARGRGQAREQTPA